MEDADKDKEQLINELEELRQRIAELGASEARYRAILDNANEIIVVVQDNVSKYSNPTAAKITGYSQKELTSRPFVEFVHPDDRHIAVENYSMRLKGDWATPGKPVRIMGKDGSVRWIEFSGSTVVWEGKPALMYLAHDVTQWKEMEQILSESEARYRELADSITDVFFALDSKLRCTYWNRTSEVISGIPAQNALGKRIDDIFPSDEATGKVMNIYRSVLATKEPQRFVSERIFGRREDVFDTTVYSTREGLCVYARDITERRKLEQALLESEQWYRHIFDHAPFGIGFSSLDGKVITMNKAMEIITGYSLEEFGKITLADIYVDKADREVLLQEIRRQGGVVDYPLRLRRKDGTEYDAIITTRLASIGDKEFILTILADVTERKRAENAIIVANERLQYLLSSTSAVIYSAKSSGDYGATFVSQSVTQMSGYEPREFIENSNFWIDHVHPDDLARVLSDLSHVSERDYYSYEYRFRRKDGTYIWVSDDMRLVRDANGQPLEIIGYWADVTERKQAEEALKESEERYRALVELSPEAIFVAVEGRHVFVNSAGLELFGASTCDQIIGKPVMDVIHPDYREIVAQRMQDALKTGRVLPTNEEQFVRLDGTVIDVEVRAAPLLYQGKPAMQAVIRDRSERKKSEEALRLSEQNFRDSIENSPLGIRIVSEDGDTLYANRALLAIYGYGTIEELASMPTKQRYTPQSYAEHRKRVEKRKMGGYVPPNYEINIVRKDGQVRELAVSRGEVLWDGERQFQVVYQDITERKTREQEYQAIIRATVDGFWQADMKGHFLDVNEAYCNLIGYSHDELLNMSISDIEAIETSRETAKRINKIKDVGHDRFESRHRRKDGEIIDVEISANYLPIHGGRMVVFIRDIAERKQAEEALRISEERYRLIAENASDVIWTMDMNMKMNYISPSCINLHGYTPEEAVNMPLEKGLTRESCQEAVKIFTEALADEAGGRTMPGRHRSFEAEFIHKDGSKVWTETVVTFIRDEAGKAIGIQGVTRNINERKQAEEAVRASEGRYRLLAENVRDVIWSMDMDLRFTYVSPSVKYLGNRTPEEVMSMSFEQLITPNSRELAVGIFAEELARANAMPPDPGRSRTIEVEFIRRDGSTLWAELKMSFMRDDAGKPVGILGVMRDITERKKAEEEKRALEQKAQFASRLASVGELSAGVAHEINNPLTGVIGYAELLMQEDVPEKIRDDLKIIHEGANRVADIVKGLLTFARQTKPERTIVDINQVIEVALRLRAYELMTNNIKVTTSFAPDLPLTIADAGQLQQVFLNLIINAETEMRLARGKGKLEIKTEQIDDTIRISFRDDGPGIASDNLERIFDPFFTTREEGKGTGLGLSICHGIVAEHGGRIYVESKLGCGATFVIELPIVDEAQRPKLVKPARVKENVTGAKILVVDDEPVVRKLLSQVLTEEGYVVETTDNGKDALHKIRGNSYSLILMDMKLPGMSGSELYKRIQKAEPSVAKRVVFITGDVMATDTEAFLSQTKLPYIHKPFDVHKLGAEINRLLARQRTKRTHKAKKQKPKVKSKSGI